MKMRNGAFLSEKMEYTVMDVEQDIRDNKISLGSVISAAEAARCIQLTLNDDGRIFAYDVSIEEIASHKKDKGRDSLILFKTKLSQELIDAGLADTPAKMCSYVYTKVCARVRNGKMNAHHYNSKDLLRIKEALDKPLAIIKTKAADGSYRLAILTSVRDYRSNLSLVILQEDKNMGDNYIPSIYGREKVAKYLYHQQEQGNLIYLGDTEPIREVTSKKDKDYLNILISRWEKEQGKIPDKNKCVKSPGRKKRTNVM
jgi:hypothetical protein